MGALMFQGQREDEEVIVVFRRHLITTKKGMGFFVIMLALAVLLLVLWPNNGAIMLMSGITVALGGIGFAYAYSLWYFSVFILTSQRLRQIAQRGWFRKTVVDLALDKIENLAFHVGGIGAGILNYGTLIIQTSGGEMVISQVAEIERVYNIMQDALKKELDKK